MTGTDRELEGYRESFREEVADAVPREGDPDPETIWKAVNGNLTPEQTLAVIDRAVESPSCAREWLLARRMSTETEPERVTSPASRPSRPYSAVAVAAGLLIAVTLATWIWAPDPAERTYRGAREDLVSLIPDGSPVLRDAAVIEWEPVTGAREYSLRILGPDFGVILLEEGLERPVFTIPEESLSGVEDGGEIRWQVEVVFPDGTRSLSRLFRATVGSQDRP